MERPKALSNNRSFALPVARGILGIQLRVGRLNMENYICALALVSLLSAGTAAAADREKKVSKQIQKLYAMAPDDFRSSATIRDDALETVATITTQNGFQEKQGLLGLVNSDHFFRAFVDKKSGATTYQVYKFVKYYGQWVNFELVNYETDKGPVSKSLDVLSRNVLECNQLLGCLHEETVAWNVDETLLRWIASRYAPGEAANTIWRFRLKGKSGAQADYGFIPAEVAGLLLAVDNYKRQHGLQNISAATPAADASAVQNTTK